MIKGVFFDIDGTLVSLKTHKMTEEDRLSLLKLHENGIKVFLATGRHREIVDNAVFPIDGIIHGNGTMAHITTDGRQHSVRETAMFRQIFSRPFPREVAVAIAKVCRDHEFATVVFPGHEPFINIDDDRMKLGRNILNLPYMPIKDIVGISENYDIYAFCPQIQEKDEHFFDPFREESSITRWHPEFIDINPEGTSKAVALRQVADCLGWSMDEVAAFGDGTNDAPMIEAAGTGVAMGNALPEAKAVADMITDDVDNCGVTKALRELGLI